MPARNDEQRFKLIELTLYTPVIGEIGGVQISPGDLIVGDLDGVVVVPGKVEDEVLELAVKKASGEQVVRKAVEAGMSTTEAFRKYGIL